MNLRVFTYRVIKGIVHEPEGGRSGMNRVIKGIVHEPEEAFRYK